MYYARKVHLLCTYSSDYQSTYSLYLDFIDWKIQSGHNLSTLERRLQNILRSIEACVVPDDWDSGYLDLIPLSLSGHLDLGPSIPTSIQDSSVLEGIDTLRSSSSSSSTSTSSSSSSSSSSLASSSSSVPSISLSESLTTTTQPTGRRSSRFEIPTGREKGKEAIFIGLPMRILAEDFLHIPDNIPRYR